MKKIIYLFIIAISTIFTLNGCNQDQVFDLQRPPINLWQADINKIDLGVINVYTQLITDRPDYPGCWGNPISAWNNYDYESTDMGTKIFGASSGEIPKVDMYYYRQQNTLNPAAPPFVTFLKCYRSINEANIMLDFIIKNENSGKQAYNVAPFVYNDIIPRTKGELFFSRAYAYFYLAEFFCPPYYSDDAKNMKLPKKFDYITDPDILRNTPLMNTVETYDSIVSDLKKAKYFFEKDPNFPENPEKWNKEGRANYWAASALLARVEFMMGTDESKKAALEECDYIIKNGPYTIDGIDPIEAFNKKIGSNCKEVIFEFASVSGIDNWAFADNSDCSMSKTHPLGFGGGRAAKENLKNAGYGDWNLVQLTQYFSKYSGWMDDKFNPTPEALLDKRYKQLYWRTDTFYISTNLAKKKDTKTAMALMAKAAANARPGEAKLLADITKDNIFKKSLSFYPNIEKINYVARPTWLTDSIDYLNGYPRGGIAFKFMDNVRFNKPTLLLDKYFRYTKYNTTELTERNNAAKIPIIRFAEILLTHAILSYKSGDITSALTDINKIRTRAGVPELKSLTEEDIHKERVKELAGEGDRIRYLMALKMDIGPGDRKDVAPVSAPYTGWTWSIPKFETDVNAAY